MLKMAFVGAIAERFVLGQPTAADRYQFASAQSVKVAVLVYYFKLALYSERAVVVHCYFSLSHSSFVWFNNKYKSFSAYFCACRPILWAGSKQDQPPDSLYPGAGLYLSRVITWCTRT
jgi:hypothetical protein